MSGFSSAGWSMFYYPVKFYNLKPDKMRINPAKTQGRPRHTAEHWVSLTAIKIFLCWRKPIIYSGLAVLLVESDFSKLSMLDFDELMNWHGDTCPGQGPAVDLTGCCQKAKDLLWLSVNKWQAFLFSSTPSFIGLIHIFAGDKWSFIQSPHQVSIVSWFLYCKDFSNSHLKIFP